MAAADTATIERRRRKMDKAETAKDAARAEYETVNDEYQLALRAAFGPGGGYNPRSPEAEYAETRRVAMLAARHARDLAHSVWMAARIEWQRANGWC